MQYSKQKHPLGVKLVATWRKSMDLPAILNLLYRCVNVPPYVFLTCPEVSSKLNNRLFTICSELILELSTWSDQGLKGQHRKQFRQSGKAQPLLIAKTRLKDRMERFLFRQYFEHHNCSVSDSVPWRSELNLS